MNEQHKTSIFPDKNIQHIPNDIPSLSTTFITIFLIVGMLCLKKFIYIKDKKRHGK